MFNYFYLLFSADTQIEGGNLPKGATNSDTVRTIINIVLGIAGALALLMLVISGIRYILSSGDPNNIAKAKDGIIYALIGLLVALVAEAIVSFVAVRL